MADAGEEKLTAVVAPVQSEEKIEEATKLDSQEEEESDVEQQEEIILDEPSDTENYEPKSDGEEVKDDDDDAEDSCSSGEEEEEFYTVTEQMGEQKFMKLRFNEVEKKIKELKEQEEGEEDSQQEEIEEEGEEAGEDAEKKPVENPGTGELSADFKHYRTANILDEDMEEYYNSDDDDNFNPLYERFSDVEYSDGEERDTESEPETEEMEGTHKKTGEALKCIKMIEQLQIPPRDAPCSPGDMRSVKSDQPMECS